MFWAGASLHKYDILLKPSVSTGHVQRIENKILRSLQWMVLDPPCLSSVKNYAKTATLQDITNNYELNGKSYMGCDFKQYHGNHSPGHVTAHHAVIHKSTQLRFAVTTGSNMRDQNDKTDIYMIIMIHMPHGPPRRPLHWCT